MLISFLAPKICAIYHNIWYTYVCNTNLTVCEFNVHVPKCFIYRYDPRTDAWTLVAPMSIGRDAIGVSVLGDRLIAVGGYDGQSYLSIVEAYDPQTNEWEQVKF